MVKPLTFLALLVTPALLIAVDQKPPNFRHVHWGMTMEEVKASEPEKPVLEKGNIVLYHATVAGFDTAVGYVFASQRLVRANYLFEIKHTNDHDFIDDFEKIKANLTEKYGKPKDDDVIWKNSLYKDDPDDWGTAIAAGQLVYETSWETPTTEILEVLKGDNFEITLKVQYKSIVWGHLEDADKQEKEKNDF
jgi:hypothetical protein